MVKGQNRGTITNDQGVFSIVVLKGDKVEFTILLDTNLNWLIFQQILKAINIASFN